MVRVRKDSLVWRLVMLPSRNNNTACLSPLRMHVLRVRRLVFWAAWLGLLLIALNVISGIIDSPLAYAQPTPSTVLLKGAPSHPNTVSPTAGSASLTHAASQAGSGAATPYTPQTITHGMQHEAMTPGSLALQVNKATRFVGSDGRLELDIPAGAIIAQADGASGSNAGGELSLGTY